MAQAVANSSQTMEVVSSSSSDTQERLVLKLHKPKSEKKVQWDDAVVDNEYMGKKKSKCCCIYMKPRSFDSDLDSDSDSDVDCGDCCHEHHVARRMVPKHPPSHDGQSGSTEP